MVTSRCRARWTIFWFLVCATPLCSDEPTQRTQHPPVRWMAFHSYLRDLATVKRFGELGIHTVTCFPANTLSSVGVPYSPYPPIWLGPNMYDFALLDRQLQEILAANPRAVSHPFAPAMYEDRRTLFGKDVS